MAEGCHGRDGKESTSPVGAVNEILGTHTPELDDLRGTTATNDLEAGATRRFAGPACRRSAARVTLAVWPMFCARRLSGGRRSLASCGRR